MTNVLSYLRTDTIGELKEVKWQLKHDRPVTNRERAFKKKKKKTSPQIPLIKDSFKAGKAQIVTLSQNGKIRGVLFSKPDCANRL